MPRSRSVSLLWIWAQDLRLDSKNGKLSGDWGELNVDLGVYGRNRKATSVWAPHPHWCCFCLETVRLCILFMGRPKKKKKKRTLVLDLRKIMKGLSLSSDLCQLFIACCFQRTSPPGAFWDSLNHFEQGTLWTKPPRHFRFVNWGFRSKERGFSTP